MKPGKNIGVIFMGKSKFLRVKCKCGNEQIIFGNAASVVKCLVCNAELGRPTGSRFELHAKAVQVL